MQQHPQVSEWLKDRPISTQIKYGSALKHFCDSAGISPTEFQDLEKKKARDLAWSYIKEFKGSYPAKASSDLAALRSFYRFKDGETLPFDARKGGKHYIQLYRKKAKYEKIPNKNEAYRIIDAATGLRDRAMFLLLLQSGCRLNVLLHLRVGKLCKLSGNIAMCSTKTVMMKRFFSSAKQEGNLTRCIFGEPSSGSCAEAALTLKVCGFTR